MKEEHHDIADKKKTVGLAFLAAAGLIIAAILLLRLSAKRDFFDRLSEQELSKMGVTRVVYADGHTSYGYTHDFQDNKEKRDYRLKATKDKLYKAVGSYVQTFERSPDHFNDSTVKEYSAKDATEIIITDDHKKVEYVMADGAKIVFELDESNAGKLLNFIDENASEEPDIYAQ